jgi:hypothetical protein
MIVVNVAIDDEDDIFPANARPPLMHVPEVALFCWGATSLRKA